ncbi:hypothetical protein SAMN06265795_12717 [Noviherbaspirillum humi]|uniref:Collagenase NC10 and Endostatin n=1 Tax=Noviherbaspirillum humi TaxID=1688639 RepID=A0A239LVY0_9BURK|nr:hypothetical protein [Noviherbaspirillum humi]SNT34621.1 hypothetical protein SAMN06265795_12717 [Noviherbaspirillum humi]
MKTSHLLLGAGALAAIIAGCAQSPRGNTSSSTSSASSTGANPMSFFVTGAGSGNGANLGGLSGADQICQSAAAKAGAGGRTWRAYLSTQATSGAQAVNARDRIGTGPWYNAKGELIARNVEELHGNPNINKQTALTESGAMINGRGDTPNRHDMLTGSQPDGRAFPPDKDMTCRNWTSSGEGAAMLGHHDRTGLSEDPPQKSWNSSHASRGGCGQEALKGTGGDGLFYCFAVR